MNDILEFLQIPGVQIVGWTLGAIGWIVGIVSGLVQLKSYFEQKRLETGYLSILEQAKRDWEGRYTEEQIEDLAQELARLQDKIQRDVPQEARRVFLEDQRFALSENLGELYSRYMQLSEELGRRSEPGALSTGLERAIETTIMPSYVMRQRKQQAIHSLLVILLIVVILVNVDLIAYILTTTDRMLSFAIIVPVMAYILSRLSKGKIEQWASSQSTSSRLAILFSWSVSTFLMLVFSRFMSWLALPGFLYGLFPVSPDRFHYLVGLTLVSACLAFSILSSFHALSGLVSKHTGAIRRRRQD